MRVHEIKIELPFYEAVATGEKTFEIRRNDREYQAGDVVVLSAVYPVGHFTSGALVSTRPPLCFRVGYVTAYAQKEGFVVFSLLPFEQ